MNQPIKNALPTKLTLLGLIVCIIQMHCIKKKVEDETTQLIVAAMTTGSWTLKNFEVNGENQTELYERTVFIFYPNNSLVATTYQGSISGSNVPTGVVESSYTGSWMGNLNNRTIETNFPEGPPFIKALNGTWNITRNDWNNVYAGTGSMGVTDPASGTTGARKMHLQRR
jgi:hypothetical protein